jgi:hypothetical protein
LRSGFNADRKVLQERIGILEKNLAGKVNENKTLENKIHILIQAEGSTKNEINFWNGKVSTLKRDLEFQQNFNEKS